MNIKKFIMQCHVPTADWAKAQELKRTINATDQEIDKMVYALYGLTEEEIAIVVGRPAPGQA